MSKFKKQKEESVFREESQGVFNREPDQDEPKKGNEKCTKGERRLFDTLDEGVKKVFHRGILA